MFSEILQRLKNENFYWNIGFYALILAGIIHFLFIFLFVFLDIPQLIIANIVSLLVYTYCIFGLSLKTLDTKDDSFIGWLVYFELIGHGLIATYYLGLESGFQYYMYTLILLPFFTLTYTTFIWILRIFGVIIVVLTVEFWGHNNSPIIQLDGEYISILHYMNLTFVLIILALISYFYTINANKYQNLLFQQSNVDVLTNLYNRRFIGTFLKKNKMLSNKENNAFALLLIDIDFFKKINDTYGHKCGDKVLVKLASILKKKLRQDTIVSRWGGEEFLIIVENTTRDELLHLAERLRVAVEKSILDYEKNIRITITLGGAMAQLDEKFDSVLSRADESLYQGKENGKNQVIIAK